MGIWMVAAEDAGILFDAIHISGLSNKKTQFENVLQCKPSFCF